ncbi:MAG: substrate-binding domain-containing protein [Thermodesulfobacteriota bacterium]
MRTVLRILMPVLLSLLLLAGWSSAQDKVIKMSTTTSTQDSGLLDVLLPELKKDTGIEVKVVAKGTGASIKDGMDGNVDVIFVHAKQREDAFVAEGYGTKRYAVMHNDFVLVGSAKDPAKIKGLKSATEALKKIAQAKAVFVSRGDDSGTHTMEQALWAKTGLPLEEKTTKFVEKGKEREIKFKHPAGDWYKSIGQGMGKTLIFADEKLGYTLTDRATFYQMKFGKDKPVELVIVVEGDPLLFNPYGVIPVNPKKHPHAKYDLAEKFSQWLVSARGQSLIARYKVSGQQVFFPDAIPDAK